MNCIMKDFRKYWTRMKINAESQKKQSDQPRNKIVLNWFQKINWLFMLINRLSLSAIYKNTDQTVLKQWGIEIFTHKVYIGSLLPWATSSPKKSLDISLSNQPQITQHKHQRGNLEPFKNTHPLWNTNNICEERHFSAYEHNNICEERRQLRVENKDKQLGTSGGT